MYTTTIPCKECGRPNIPTTKICVCGAMLLDASQIGATDGIENLDSEDVRSQYGLSKFNGRSVLMVGVEEASDTFIFDGDEIEELTLGRADGKEAPAINLTAHGALEKGVSRVHAKIIRRDGSLQLEDLESRNGTYLNGHRMYARQPRILRDGDVVRLGKLTLRITYKENKQKTPGANTP